MSIRALSGSGLSPASPVGNAYASSLTLSGGVVKNPYTGTGVTITIGTVNGTGPYTSTITLTGTNPAWTSAMVANAVLQATAGTGSLGTGTVTVTSVVSSTSVNISSTATMSAGTITDLLIVSYGTGVFSAPASLTANTTLSSGLTVNGSGGLIVSSGNVGIGTSSPNLQLTLTGSLLLFNNSTGIHQNIYYNSGWKYSANGYGWAISDVGSGMLAFQMAPNNTSGAGATATVSQPVVITNSGSVGIGTTSPANMLHIAGETAQYPTSIYIAPTGHATSDRAGIAIDNWEWMQDTGGSGTKDFALYQRSANTTRLNISTSGNVGIGISSPSATLHVTGTVAGAVAPRCVISPGSFIPNSVGPTMAYITSGSDKYELQYADGTDRIAYTTFSVPYNYSGGAIQIKIYWYISSGTNSQVRWEGWASSVVSSGAINSDPAIVASVNAGVGSGATATTLIISTMTWSTSLPAAGSLLYFGLKRVPSDTNDTSNASANVQAVAFEFGS